MRTFEWQNDLETGIELIDGQHQQYGRFVNAFLRAYSKGRVDHGKTEQAFGFLRAYVREHLSTEEMLMKECDYPDMAAHLNAHVYFSQWVQDVAARLGNEQHSDDFAMEASCMLVEWFQEHIKSTDKCLTAFLQDVAEGRRGTKLQRLLRSLLKRPTR